MRFEIVFIWKRSAFLWYKSYMHYVRREHLRGSIILERNIQVNVSLPKVWTVVSFFPHFISVHHLTTFLFGAFPSKYCLGKEKCPTSFTDIEGVSSCLPLLLENKVWVYNPANQTLRTRTANLKLEHVNDDRMRIRLWYSGMVLAESEVFWPHDLCPMTSYAPSFWTSRPAVASA